MLASLTDQFSILAGLNGDLEKEFELVKTALKEKKRINDNRGLVWSYYRLAHIYQSIGDYESALGYFRQSYYQAKSQSLDWRINRSMGNLFFAMTHYDSTRYYFQQGLTVALDATCMEGL